LNAVARQLAVNRENLRLRTRLSEEVRVRRDVLARLDDKLPDLLRECPACGACFSGEVETCAADGTALVLSLPITRTVDGRYRLDRLLGKGGMGAVYAARDLRLERDVAVKIMLSRAFGQPGALRRFRREARTAAGWSPEHRHRLRRGLCRGEGAYIVWSVCVARRCARLSARAPSLTLSQRNGSSRCSGPRGGARRRHRAPRFEADNVMGHRDAAGRCRQDPRPRPRQAALVDPDAPRP
jgi:hypothetical protein